MNSFKFLFLTCLGKFITWFSRSFNLGHGSTWPGHLALKIYPDILSFYCSQLTQGLVLVAGTNGKTTTVKMTRTVLEKKGFKVIHNESGANLLNGIVSSFLLSGNLVGKIEADYGVFETDEATLPIVINKLRFTKMTIVLLNLFRDQLDRYGEVDTIARKWKAALAQLNSSSVLILNANDPQIAVLGKDLKAKTLYFGLNDPKIYLQKKEHATDSVYCPHCGTKLDYLGVYYSHLGDWKCPRCAFSTPKLDLSQWTAPLSGLYNLFNTLAAVLTCQSLGLKKEEISSALENFTPAFGRQEEFKIEGKSVKVFLTKNPVSVNEVIRTIITNYPINTNQKISQYKNSLTVLLALNDNIPDGTDVSWIWDVEFEELVPHCQKIICGGERAYDLGLRLKYAGVRDGQMVVEKDLHKAIVMGLISTNKNETLFILPTYSAMLAVRKILSGKKIL